MDKKIGRNSKKLFILFLLISSSIFPNILPEGFEKLLIYYNNFEGENGKAMYNPFKINEIFNKVKSSEGFFGKGYISEVPMFAGGGLTLKSSILSPHKSLTISIWWALKDTHIPGHGFQIFSFNGKGFISNFVRGGGGDTWCALLKPAGVFQVYYFPSLQNINGIYDFDIMRTLNLQGGVWHNTVVTFSCGREITLYQDGKKVGRWVLTRTLKEEDGIYTLSIACGEPLIFDEILIIRGIMREDDVERYYNILKELRKIFMK